MEGILGSPKLLILLTQKAPWERSFIFRNKNCVPDFFQAILNVSSPQAGEGRAQRENDRRKERGIWGGALEENRGPHLTAVLLTDGSQVCIVYRRSTRAVPCAALAFPSLRRFLTPHLPAGHREKFCRTQAHVQLGTRLRRMAGPKGK